MKTWDYLADVLNNHVPIWSSEQFSIILRLGYLWFERLSFTRKSVISVDQNLERDLLRVELVKNAILSIQKVFQSVKSIIFSLPSSTDSSLSIRQVNFVAIIYYDFHIL